MEKVFGDKDYVINFIKFCPFCGAEYQDGDYDAGETVFCCQSCKFRYFKASNPAATAVIPKRGEEHKVLINRRNKEPNKGKFDCPGGFLTYHESAEEAVRREVMEELGIGIVVQGLLDSSVGDYVFADRITSCLVIACLVQPIENVPEIKDHEEIAECFFFDLQNLEKEKENFSFPGEWQTLLNYRNNLQK